MKETKQQGIIAQKKTEIEKTQEKEEKQPQTILSLINDPTMKAQFARALPAVITPERFSRIVLTAVRNNPRLGECDRASFFAAVMQSAQLGLEPNTPLGQAYLIPFWNGKKKVYECQFQIGYKGLIDLAYRSGEVSIIQAQAVHANDTFIYELGLEAKLVHKPLMEGDRGEAIAYYAIFKMKNGGENFAVMSRNDVVKFAQKYSKAYTDGPWQTNFDAMAKKTVLKQVLKYAPIHSENLATALVRDEKPLLVDMETGEIFSKELEIVEEPLSGDAEGTQQTSQGNVPEGEPVPETDLKNVSDSASQPPVR